jgi:hypothetical protein
MGDFNDYELSPPLQTLSNSGLFNVLRLLPEEERYTYVFGGISQLIDGIFVSPDVEPLINTVTILHSNADYPDIFGSSLEPELMPFRASDHDIPLVVLDLDTADVHEVKPGEALSATVAAADNTPVEDRGANRDRALVIGGVLMMVLAGLGGFWFGRHKETIDV